MKYLDGLDVVLMLVGETQMPSCAGERRAASRQLSGESGPGFYPGQKLLFKMQMKLLHACQASSVNNANSNVGIYETKRSELYKA